MSDVLVPHGPMSKPYAFQPPHVKAVLDDLRRRYCDRAVMFQVQFGGSAVERTAVLTVLDEGVPVEIVDVALPVLAGAA